MTELHREDVTHHTGSPRFYTSCIVCGERVTLRFNGGELDSRSCCGMRYSLEAPRIDFVIHSEAPAAPAPLPGCCGLVEMTNAMLRDV